MRTVFNVCSPLCFHFRKPSVGEAVHLLQNCVWFDVRFLYMVCSLS